MACIEIWGKIEMGYSCKRRFSDLPVVSKVAEIRTEKRTHVGRQGAVQCRNVISDHTTFFTGGRPCQG